MYFPFLELHGWGKRLATRPQTICSEFPYIPDIRLPEETRPIGRWGHMHRDYIKEHNPKVAFWYARELMPLLGYERWENFDKAIFRAMDSCETSGIEVDIKITW